MRKVLLARNWYQWLFSRLEIGHFITCWNSFLLAQRDGEAEEAEATITPWEARSMNHRAGGDVLKRRQGQKGDWLYNPHQ